MSDEPEDVGHEKEQLEEAFTQSESHSLGELKLQSYSEDRVIAAQAMGLHYGFVDQAGQEQFHRTNIYPGALRDVSIVLWLCSLDDVKDERGNVTLRAANEIDGAARDPISGAQKAGKWAKAQGIIDTSSAEFWQAFELFFKIMREVEISRTRPEKKTTKESKPETTTNA